MRQIQAAVQPGSKVDELAGDIEGLARYMNHQVQRGVHKNPALAIVGGNPPSLGKHSAQFGDAVFRVEYHHVSDPPSRLRYHDFEHSDAVSLHRLSPYQVLIQGTAPIAKFFPAP